MIQWHGHHGVMVYSKEDYIIQLPLEELANPKFQLIYMHPEVCVQTKEKSLVSSIPVFTRNKCGVLSSMKLI